MSISKQAILLIHVCLASLLLVACGNNGQEITAVEPPTQQSTTRPSVTPKPTNTPWPTKTATATQTKTPTVEAETKATATKQVVIQSTPDFIPTNTPGCYNFLQFVDDITIPDGENVEAGEPFVKTWRVENLGDCYISDSYTLFPLNGSLTVIEISPLPLIGPDEEGNVSVTLRAPSEPGRYIMNWQMSTESGADRSFGQLYLEIVVPEPE